ncbi:hypothetical protein LTR36_006951 [Oleoguttula mirabilis]|uniref:Potassium transport protein n=1 Tax=Oleoguttula mirabilis TaxID=1507867 RepID=A0AAV9JBJ2_9PEZI|nr:hypothetical protein LTR36_006951 [Oleoguttula mirabilis]
MFEPFEAAITFARGLHPRNWGGYRPNFITAHYMYMVGWSLVGAVIVYGATNMAFIDALFFAGGAATQSGLNTINVNQILLYQQVTLMLIACVCNPVFINTAVVFVRLYWFEKRFEHIVKESQANRRTRTRSFTKSRSEMKGDDASRLEAGVRGRKIQVLHETTKPNGMSGSTAKTAQAQKDFEDKLAFNHDQQSMSPTPPGGSNKSSDNSDEVAPDEKPEQETAPETPTTPAVHYMGLNPKLNRDITFADEVQRPGSGHAMITPQLARVPENFESNKHVQFIERQQRNAQSEVGTLRIPGPRDFDKGDMPKELDDPDDGLTRPDTRNTVGLVTGGRGRARSDVDDGKSEELNADDHPRRGITIDEPEHPGHRARSTVDGDDDGDGDEDRGNTTSFMQTLSRARSRLTHRRNASGGPKLSDARASMARTFSSMRTARTDEKTADSMPYLSWQATIGRNSAFVDLTEEQREELGGIEYRALKTLVKILIGYFVGFHLLGMVVMLPWILYTQQWRKVVESDGMSVAWWGVFTPASMFNDLGLTLTPDSMVSFQTATLPLLLGSYLIIIGNTGFPCMLRFTIWVISKCVSRGTPLWEELQFLLDHPRRCFTLLFPSKATWWLFWVLVLLNGIDLIFFIILDLDDTTVTSLSPGFRVLNGWFQATSTRTAGFSCVNLADLHPAIQVSYLIMMYISVFPIAISVRRTNVYEEKSLGIFGGEEAGDEEAEQSYVGQHLRRQLSFDLWYVFLGFFIICIVEGGRLSNTNEYAFTMFSVLFEIVSAYGTVGLSLGYPNIDASFSAEFHVISKLVIVAMMIRGRHRGLPYALDRAILLPSDNMHKKDAEAQSMRRRNSMFERQETWEDGDLDESGLPMQHTGRAAQAMAAGAGGGETSPEGHRRMPRRRSSVFTTGSGVGGEGGQQQSGKRKHDRSLSLGLLAGGLSVGPTTSKYD